MNSAKRSRSSREETRERIMSKADELLRRYGYGKTTVADIASELDMSPANVYKFFSSKDAIIEMSAERNVSKIRDAVLEVVRSGGPAMDRIEKIVFTIFRFNEQSFANERQMFKLVVVALEQNWDCVRRYHESIGQAVTTGVEEGMASGEFRKGDPKSTAQNVIDCLSLIIQPHMRHKYNYVATDERIREHLRFVARALQ